MIALSPPRTVSEEDAALTQICKDVGFAPHAAAWQQAYDLYRRKRGNGFALRTLPLPDAIKRRQKALYTNRRSSPNFEDLRRQLVPCCTRCGSPGTGHLDHHLPEAQFPEFAVLPSNLVPTCGHCNSGSKQAKIKGAAWPERFIHPYFDRFAERPLWRAILLDPVVVQFLPRPEPSLGTRLSKLVSYNLENLLGWQFQNHLVNLWKGLPSLLQNEAGGSSPTDAHLERVIDILSVSATTTSGINGWQAAMLRGLRNDHAARSHIVLAAGRTIPVP